MKPIDETPLDANTHDGNQVFGFVVLVSHVTVHTVDDMLNCSYVNEVIDRIPMELIGVLAELFEDRSEHRRLGKHEAVKIVGLPANDDQGDIRADSQVNSLVQKIVLEFLSIRSFPNCIYNQ